MWCFLPLTGAVHCSGAIGLFQARADTIRSRARLAKSDDAAARHQPPGEAPRHPKRFDRVLQIARTPGRNSLGFCRVIRLRGPTTQSEPTARPVMVMIVLFILAAGTFMEGSVLIIMLTPIFLPLVTKYGIDPVHFGLVFIIAATIGNYTPPLGAAMFVACQVLRCPISEYTRDSMPFLIAVTIVTLILIFVPSVVLIVPDLIFGPNLR
jgi:hypothetical protein